MDLSESFLIVVKMMISSYLQLQYITISTLSTHHLIEFHFRIVLLGDLTCPPITSIPKIPA